MTVRSRTSAAAVLAVALLAGVLSLLPAPAAAATTPFISELHYDNAGTDVDEGVEIEADPGTDLGGYQVVPYNGGGNPAGGTYTPIVTLPSPTVVPEAGVIVVPVVLQNGSPDGVALVDAAGVVLEFLSYEGAFTASNGPAAGMTSTDIGVSQNGSEAIGLTLQKINGAWTGPIAGTMGARNGDGPVDPEPGECTGTGFTHTIAEVQGTGATTPVPGPVKVTGVVTADHRSGGYNGIYVQTAGSGGSRPVAAGTASDGVFIYFGNTSSNFPSVAIGDVVEVSGTAGEFSGMTQISTSAAADTAVCSSDATLPAPVELTFPLSNESRESVEGMLVTPTGPATVSDIYNTNRYGEITLAAGTEPAPIPTDLFAPGTPEAIAQKAANIGGRFLLDDGRTTNLSTAGLLPPYFTAAEPLRVGDRVAAWGSTVLGYGFDEWRLQPTLPFDGNTAPASVTTFDRVGRPAAPEAVGGDIKLASFNVLNFFVNYGGNARGAANPAAKDKQKAKIVSAITALDADVVALEEIENSVRFPNGGQAALEELVAALNDADGAGTWDHVRTPTQLPPAAQQDVITTAIIFKPAAVTPVGASVSVNDESVWFNAREPIAQTFSAGDATFTVIANHLKSKSNTTPPQSGNDNEDVGDGQGAFNGDRVRQAEALVAFAEELKTSSGSDDVMLFGDFNAYGQEEPMQVLYDAGYVNVNAEQGTGKHSYVFQGEEGSLDHGLASGSLAERVTGADIWEINAHESFAYQYDGVPSFYDPGPYRSSDHNPEVIGIDTGDDGPTGPVDLQILTINDFHGRLTPPGTTSASATPPNAPIGGAAQLAGLVDELRAENPNTAFVAAGDNIGASTFVSAIQDDEPTIETLDAMGLDVSSVGNHEFDKGIADLTDRVEPLADFPYLAANVLLNGQPVLDPYVVQDVGGVQVGYIGVVTDQLLSLVSPGGMTGVTVTDPIAATEAVAADLSDGDPANGEADVVVLLAHEGADGANSGSVAELESDPVFGDFMDLSDDVDVIVSGHTHIPFAFVATKPNGEPRPVIEAEEYGKKLGKVTLSFDPATGEISDPAAVLIDVVGKPVNQTIQTMVNGYVAEANTLGSVEVGSITADIKRAYVGTTTNDDRGKESVMGNFIADVQLAGTTAPEKGGAQIAFMNAGGLRKDLLYAPDGKVTYSELFDVQPFANDMVTKTYTGAEIKAVLEEQWQPAGASRPVIWLGVSEGFTYQYDPTRPQGSRVIASSMKLNGVTIDPAGTYRVTINGFLATGGDNFATLAGGTDRVATGDNDLMVLKEYFELNSPVTADTEPRTSIYNPNAPFETLEDRVTQQYLDVAGRRPSANELLLWSAAIDNGSRSVEQLVVQLLTVDKTSPESRVIRIYDAFFKRPPDQAGFDYWVRQLTAGKGVQRIAEQFAQSSEFRNTYGSLSDAAFVDLVYTNVLERPADSGGRTYWINQISSKRMTRGDMMAQFSESAENIRRTTVHLQVIELYRSLLQRMPTKAEAYPQIAAVRSGEKSLEDVVADLHASPAYTSRFP